ncbi:putative membrane protein [Campylobacter blaseri]|uniref:Uncharacterized protein n=1 Tax=Campylobacter blaseri TaxID=2042961 RepID=A0A2P8QZX4_9BACT|nr:hypothetical protein [Campylobacter blaseri]PSM51797.1 hypothetical protein CQ405_06630 [Campylobacter blaseri]PSM53588.1 hypothetical protein CRN67_06635 [Campylobacter blaseri]QKF86400.1 putative membrane protein [Campylobacter blaseri]
MIKRLFKIYISLDFILIFISLFLGKYWLLNSQISFFISVFISYISMKNYQNMIDSELLSGKYDDIKEDENVKIGTVKNSVTFFSPLKILAYLVLGVSFYILNKLEMLNPLAFLVGVLPMPLGSIIYGATDVANFTKS